MQKSFFAKLSASVLAVCFLFSGMSAASDNTAAEQQTKESESLTIGVDAKDAFKIQLTNKTGLDIAFFTIKSYDPERDPNEEVVRL